MNLDHESQDQQCGLWLVAYGEDSQPIDHETVLRVYDCAAESFLLNGARGSFHVQKPRSLPDARRWLEDTLTHQSESRDPLYQVSLWQVRNERLLWHLYSFADSQFQGGDRHWPSDPRLIVGIDFSLARSDRSVREFIENAAGILIRDRRIWYGFIDVAPRSHVRFPSMYSGTWPEGLGSWERQVEIRYWQTYALGGRRHVRRVFWGNIFGPDFTKRLANAGYEQAVGWLRENSLGNYEPVTLHEGSTGSMAVFLDDDPVFFARNRDGELEAGSESRSIHTAAMLMHVLSRANMR